jgi:hypothetical protein
MPVFMPPISAVLGAPCGSLTRVARTVGQCRFLVDFAASALRNCWSDEPRDPMQTIALMRDIDAEYRSLSGLSDPRYYKIFYSRIDPAPLLVLGINPGGAPDQEDEIVSASESYFDIFEHDYVDCDYAIQRVMLPFLQNILGATPEDIRRIPKSNLAFRRSPGEDTFRQYHPMTLTAAMKEARPSLSRLIHNVQPTMILMETMKPEVFSQLYCGGETGRSIREPLMAMHRGRSVRAFQAKLMPVTCLQRSIPIVAIGHPSSRSFSTGNVWRAITNAVKSVCEEFGASCQ